MDLFAMSDSHGKLIQRYRKQKNMTLVELGRLTNLSHAYLSKIENSKATPSLEVLKKISGVLDPNNDEDLYNKLATATGKAHQVEKDSEVYKWLLKSGRIKESGLGKIEVLDHSYFKLNYILEEGNPIVYDIKKEIEGDSLATILLTESMINKIYKAINTIVFEGLVNNPELLYSIENNEIISNHMKSEEEKLHLLSESIKGLKFEELTRLVNEDDNLI